MKELTNSVIWKTTFFLYESKSVPDQELETLEILEISWYILNIEFFELRMEMIRVKMVAVKMNMTIKDQIFYGTDSKIIQEMLIKSTNSWLAQINRNFRKLIKITKI